MIEQAKFIYSDLGKAFEKQLKTIEDQEIKQVEALKPLKPEENQELEIIEKLFPRKTRNYEINNKIDGNKKWKEKRLIFLYYGKNIINIIKKIYVLDIL